MEKLNKIVTALNSFDIYYEMSDYDVTYDRVETERKRIENELSLLTNEQLIELKTKVSPIGKLTLQRYFKK